MKNIPHQFALIPRFEAALEVFRQLANQGRDLTSDSVVGEALALAGVHQFKNAGARSVQDMLILERTKPAASRGSHTCARDMRHFFKLMGFLVLNPDGALELTPPAIAVLVNSRAGQRMRADSVWRQALLGFEAVDAGGRSHPYQILLRLIASQPGLHKYAASLCLEARDDSEAEFARIKGIANQTNVQQAIRAIAGTAKADNAAKVLPSLAKQLGDVIEEGGRLFISSMLQGAIAAVPERDVAHGKIGSMVRRPFEPRQRSNSGRRRKLGKHARSVVINPDLLAGRFNEHEDCLDRFSVRLDQDSQKYEASYDLLVVRRRGQKALLVEAKTLRDDAPIQTRIAYGQLGFYEYFDVKPMHPKCAIFSLVLTDRPLPPQCGVFLAEKGIGVVWMPRAASPGGTDLGRQYSAQFGFDWAR